MIFVGALLGILLHGGRPPILFLMPDPTSVVMFPSNPLFWSLLNELLINIAFAVAVFRASTKALGLLLMASAICLGSILFFSSWGDGFGPKWSNIHIGALRTVCSFSAGIVLFHLWAHMGKPRRMTSWAIAIPMLLVALMLFDPLDNPVGKLVAILFVIPALVWLGISLKCHVNVCHPTSAIYHIPCTVSTCRSYTLSQRIRQLG